MMYRLPAVAGSFYPDNPVILKNMVQKMLSASENLVDSEFDNVLADKPKVIVVPHAGYLYSGSVAATAYQALKPWADSISRVVLIGPCHRVALRGISLVDPSEWQGFESPLGKVPFDQEGIEKLNKLLAIKSDNHPHYFEHSLEVQLPFLQCVLSDFKILPILVGQCEPEQVAQLLKVFLHDKETLIVVSTDMSHFHNYSQAQEIDSATNERILHLECDLEDEQACGCYPLNGLLLLAKQQGLSIHNLALFNSGDNLSPQWGRLEVDKDRVVGYASYILH